MPRKARIDYPGALHHIIVRGIEKRNVFVDEADYIHFVSCLKHSLTQYPTNCYAWALLPNHFHLLLVTGKSSISRMMQSLLTGYAVYFNKRHERSGHIFQNRYKSILCERDTYFKELIRYIHLNPFRAGMVKDMTALDNYRWCGHSVVIGNQSAQWQSIDEILALFGDKERGARENYREFIVQGANQGKREELAGGGLRRSMGGWDEVLRLRRQGGMEKSDERMLGSGDFVSSVLASVNENEGQSMRLKRGGWDAQKVLLHACKEAKIRLYDLYGGGKRPAECLARALACKWLVDEMGMKTMDISHLLKITPASVSISARKGRELIRETGYSLEKSENV